MLVGIAIAKLRPRFIKMSETKTEINIIQKKFYRIAKIFSLVPNVVLLITLMYKFKIQVHNILFSKNCMIINTLKTHNTHTLNWLNYKYIVQ